MHRRGFLISGLAAAGATTAAAAPPSGMALFEAAAPAAAAFGLAAQGAGAQVFAIRGDITDVWYRQLQPRWAAAPFPVAGLTFYPALFCLERLAWDHGLRLAAFAVHGQSHRVALAARPLQLQARLEAAGPRGRTRWPPPCSSPAPAARAAPPRPRPTARTSSHG